MRTILYLTMIAIAGLFLSCSTESTPVYQFTTHVEPEGTGTVQPAGGEFDEGSKIEITAIPQDHWVFAGWQGDHSSTINPDSVIISKDLSVTAMFEKRQYPLTIEIDGEGTVEEVVISAKSTNYQHGSTVQITAIPDDGWYFSGWSGDFTGLENPILIEMDSDKQITAEFEEMCLDPEECVSVRFYASEVIGSIVLESQLFIQNNLPDSVYLARVQLIRADGMNILPEGELNEWIDSEQSKSYPINFTSDPTVSYFQSLTALFFIEYEDESYILTQKATLPSSKPNSMMAVPDNTGKVIRAEN